MTRKIPVKYGVETSAIIILPFLFIISESISKGDNLGILIAFAVLTFICVIFFGISYRIERDQLIITNAFFWKTIIDIEKIRKVEKTWNAISSPAPSLFGRIEIYYENKSIVISPKFYEEFKNELLHINSNIVFKD